MPDDKSTILVIGTGSIGERHLRCLQRIGRREVAFCEPMEERRADVALRYGIDASLVFPTLDEALSSAEFDCAVVAAPAPFHIPLGRQLAEAGIHILMEKPLSLSLVGVAGFRRLAADRGIVVAVGYVHHAHPAIRGVKEKLDSGEFGRLLEMRFDLGQPLAHFRPAYADVYFADHEMGGGTIQDMITHFYSVGDSLAGPVDRLVTHARHLALPRVEVEDTVHTLASHGGIMASYATNMFQPANEVCVTLNCEAGSLRASYQDRRFSWISEPAGEWQHESFALDDWDEVYIRQNNAFLDAVDGKGSPVVGLESAIRTLSVNVASLESARTQSWQNVSYES
ncbi:MAG: Gfo/Idh/MocA family oxidoreductase [Verrucomicrobiales bacterium]|nr:Gfo/Idh/MocA family oxidoreductase [Verrucomicrobiales bacterium]